MLEKRSLSLSGHRTSIALEPEFWAALQTIAAGRDVTLLTLIADLDASRPPEHKLASMLRVFTLKHFLSGATKWPELAIDELIVNIADIAETPFQDGEFFDGPYKKLTPALEPRMGKLGANVTRLAPGKLGCPFHGHMVADEVFFILSGHGMFRYGDAIKEVRAGDCISCPAVTGTAHQLANRLDEDLVYLAVGMNEPHEVCIYPDGGKIMIDCLNQTGFLQHAAHMDGEPQAPKVFEMAKQKRSHT